LFFSFSYILIGTTVLLIDDDLDLLELYSHIFKNVGAQVLTACDAEEGISKLVIHRPHLLLLDIMLPGMDGFDACRQIRQISDVPLIVLTALHHEQNLVHALEAGADDFVSKPFTDGVLLARARALLRRTKYGNSHPSAHRYSDNHLTIDTERHRLLIDGKSVKAGPTEFRLLVYLERNAGKVVTYDQLLANVWGEAYSRNSDMVHVYISALRSKIEKNTKQPRYIQSVHGVGYIFERQPPQS
jgi:DNA-binding response OmpR family regulator